MSARMQIVFDRYEPRGERMHLDLATGRLVEIATHDVPSRDWRRRWRARVDALMEGCDGLEPLLDAGDAGRDRVFEVRAAALPASHRPGSVRRTMAQFAIAWLEARGLSAGPCRAGRLQPDGSLRADAQTGWPVETPAERDAARASWQAWRRLVGCAAAPPAQRPDACSYAAADERLDTRAGLVDLRLDERRALAFARASGRVALAGTINPRDLPADLRRRAFVILGAPRDTRAVWGAALAAAGPRRHFHVDAPSRAVTVRERAALYGAGDAEKPPPVVSAYGRSRRLTLRASEELARGRLASAIRCASRAVSAAGPCRPEPAEALTIKARALRLQGRAHDACALLTAAIDRGPDSANAPLLIEAAEAATDCARLEQGEAFARAALRASVTAAGQARARLALDRARVWRGEPVDTDMWRARAAWHTWGRSPAWPVPGGYAHAPCGPLARWEWLCDRLERARWRGDEHDAARTARRVLAACAGFPPLLRARADWLAAGSPVRARRAGASAILQTGKAGTVMEVFEHMSALLAACHDAGAHDALRQAAVRIREMLRAKGVAIYAAGRALPVAGDGDGWNVPSELAARCAAAAATAGPERHAGSLHAAVSIKYGGAPAGAVAACWPSHTPLDDRRVRLLLEAGALVLSPVLGAWRECAEPPRAGDMPEIVGASAAMEAVRDAVRRVSRVPFPVLIEGESGSGKELIARAIHRLSSRASRPFRALNCAAMAEELVEGELFGHAQGAFTGAVSARPGLFEDADRGTLFLDEVTELSPRAQAKLLRVLQEGEVRRVGETAPRRVDVRIVAASNRPVRDAVAARAFRADLSFRLDVLRIDVPPLRARPEDVALLCAHFWRDAAARAGTAATLSPEAVGRLAAHAWPGNVRELQNVMAAIAVSGPRRGKVACAHLPPHIGGQPAAPITLQQARATLERDLVQRALARAGGRQARAAAELGVSRQGLAKLMRRLGLPAA